MKDVLSKLEVLALDFQATQADPEKGRLLEVGWARVSASGYRENDAAIIETYLVADSSYGEIPGRVRRITGISGDDLAAASTPAEAWSRLVAVANDIARCGRRKTCPTVIHFARFTENIRTGRSSPGRAADLRRTAEAAPGSCRAARIRAGGSRRRSMYVGSRYTAGIHA